MGLPTYRITFLSQEADRPDAVRAAVAAAPLPDGVDVVVTGHPTSALGESEADVAAADVIVVSHILVEEIANAVQRLLDRARPDAQIVVLNSLWPVMQRTRLGDLRFADGPAALAAFMPTPPTAGGDFTAAFRELVRNAGSMLDRIPPRAVGIRTLLEAYVVWANPTPSNLRELVIRLVDRFGPTPGAWVDAIDELETLPRCGLYHPCCGIVTDVDDLPSDDAPMGTVGLLLMRGAIVSGSTTSADAMIARLTARGFRVIPAFAESFDFREPVERWMNDACAIVSMTGFPLIGGHNGCEPSAASDFLQARGVPYLASCALMVQSRTAWEHSGLGLSPIEVAMQPSVFELEGAIEPVVVHTLAGGDSGTKELLDDRADRLADRLLGWRRLQTLDNADKKILLTLFAFPPGKGAVGTAAYLDVFRSAWNLLERLRDEGYDVELPDSPETLLERVVEGDDKYAPVTSAGIAVGDRVDLATYERVAPDHRRVEKMWGPAPGKLNSDGRDLVVHGVRLGNVFVGVQPSFGFEGDPMRLLFERGATPHHGFLAYYRWAEEVFGAHAMIHLGTHGALEFMPGKQTGLSSACWPDILAGRTPNLYLYSVNNPSEGTIAKRRGNALTIGHLTPPADRAGLYRELETLKGLVDQYRSDDDPIRRAQTIEALRDLVADAHFDADLPDPADTADDDSRDRWVGALTVALSEIASRRIPIGLHVIGRTPTREETVEVLTALASGDDSSSLLALMLRASGHDLADVERGARARDPDAHALLESHEARVESVMTAMVDGGMEAAVDAVTSQAPSLTRTETAAILAAADHARSALGSGDEITPLMRALSGRYVPPGPGGDPARHPGVLPVGRNLHALDPASVPTPVAWRRGAAAAELLIERHVQRTGAPPRHVGLVLWGLDNIKTHGEGIAQALHLLGTCIVPNSIGRMTRVEVVPLEELGRPRVDVTITGSGIFRDIFGLHMEMLDQAVRAVAERDEPDHLNPIKARSRALVAAGFTPDEAATRVFSNAPGAYGTHIDHLVALSRWNDREELADSFARRKGFAYGRGAGDSAPQLLRALAKDIDVTAQNLDSSEVSLTDVDHYFEYLGGMTALVESESGQRPPAIVLDATSGRLRVRDLDETVRLESRARLLNPKWFEGLLAHGYEGVEEIRKRLDYTFGFSATCEATDDWVYRETHRTYLQDEDVRRRMQTANVHAFAQLVGRLSEAGERGFWSPTEEERSLLEALSDAAEDAIEGIPAS